MTSTNRLLVAGIVASATMVLLATTAAAQPAPAPLAGNAGAHTHDGVYVRLFLGVGYTHMAADEADTTVKGSGGAFGLAVGYAVSPNLIAYGELFDNVAVGPTMEVGGATYGSDDDVAAGTVGVGIGVAYYLPSNIYVSGTLAMSQVTIQQDGEEVGESEFGPGVSLMVGKEWWVSKNWGLGVAGQIYGGRMKDQGTNPPTWTTTAFTLAFSATFN